MVNVPTNEGEKKKIQKLSFLSAGRQQNISVVLGKVRIKTEDMMEYLISYDTNKLTSNICELIVPILPTQAELIEIVKYQEDHEGDINDLMECDLFCLFLNSVVGFDLRFKAIIYKNNYKKSLKEINNQIDNFLNIFDFFRNNNIFAKLFSG